MKEKISSATEEVCNARFDSIVFLFAENSQFCVISTSLLGQREFWDG